MFNRYLYVANDPINDIDPDGKCRTATCLMLNRDGGVPMSNGGTYYRGTSVSAGLTAVKPSLGLAADFTPVIGEIKGVNEFASGPSVVGGVAVVLGVVPVGGDLAGKALKHTDPRNLKATEKLRSQKNRDTIASDMKANGFDQSQPIEVVNDGGRLLIKDGHHRASAAIKAGIEDVPYKEVDVPQAELEQLRDGFADQLR